MPYLTLTLTQLAIYNDSKYLNKVHDCSNQDQAITAMTLYILNNSIWQVLIDYIIDIGLYLPSRMDFHRYHYCTKE